MDVKDILQINATIIAGAFIFLSISLGLLQEPESESNSPNGISDDSNTSSTNLSSEIQNQQSIERPSAFESIVRLNSQSFVTFLVIIWFAVSSMVAVGAELDKSNTFVYERVIKGALMFMLIGFFTLIIIAMLVFTGIIRYLD